MNKLALFAFLFVIGSVQSQSIYWPRRHKREAMQMQAQRPELSRYYQELQNLVPELLPSNNLMIIAPPERKYSQDSVNLDDQLDLLKQLVVDKAQEIEELWKKTQSELNDFAKEYEQLIEEEVANQIWKDKEELA
ncbi:uncharacterized protein [Diabrotica undecimpunctata]|uniref:uncharacterized protein isoform X2 n=1 Tax=Diabrotica undecimpunctata TaxID=50387 RepID=UPI003B636369